MSPHRCPRRLRRLHLELTLEQQGSGGHSEPAPRLPCSLWFPVEAQNCMGWFVQGWGIWTTLLGERKDQLDYQESLKHIMRCTSSKPSVPLLDNSRDHQTDEVSDIPGLRGHSFICLQSSLRRFGIEFWLDNAQCFGIRLIKLSAENALVLEEISVDTGNRRLSKHMNLDIQRWIASNSSKACLKSNNLTESSWEFSSGKNVSSQSSTHLKTSMSCFYSYTPSKVNWYGVFV